ncbi:glucose PTS transporter subunit IIA [Celerinatantimonas sp. YJH-8]|uniref:glucose PTS transporter subunit IIA n=1 Tax=Celerinatantimonas sp. YJH-8 TaxID=3228714 RepID=UPI0038CBB2B7
MTPDPRFAEELIQLVGGHRNIKSIEHCATRLRFKLKNIDQAQTARIRNHPRVIMALESMGQYQVVIGPDVEDTYQAIQQLLGEHILLPILLDKSISGWCQHFITLVTRIFQPLVWLLLSTGVLHVIVNIGAQTGLLDTGTYQLLHSITYATFHFLPIFIAFYAAKQFDISPFMVMAIAAALFHPNIDTPPFFPAITQVNTLSFLGWPIPLFNYACSVIPIMIISWGISCLHHYLYPKISSGTRYFILPLLCLIIFTPLVFLVLSPAIVIIAKLNVFITQQLNQHFPIVAGFFWGCIWPFLPRNVLSQLPDTSWLSSWVIPTLVGQAGAAWGVACKEKDVKQKSIATIAGVLALFGIPEIALFAVTLPRIKPFLIGWAASIIGTVFIAIGSSSTIPLFHIPLSHSLPFLSHLNIWFILGLLVSLIGALLGGYWVTSVTPDSKQETKTPETISSPNTPSPLSTEKAHSQLLPSPLSGQLIAQSEINDGMFSSSIMGSGIGVIPDDDTIYSPVNGIVQTVFHGQHAISLESHDGIKMLIHVGLRTIQQQGEGFTAYVQKGDTVTVGQPLLHFDKALLERSQIDLTTPVLITNSDDYQRLDRTLRTQITQGAPLLVLTND